MSTIIWNDAPQGSQEWLDARRGCVTGSRAGDARDYKSPTAADKKAGITRGEPSSKLIGYARDLAREREGGEVEQVYVNAAMRKGTEEEPLARMAYEAERGVIVQEAGFCHTFDKKFGVSVDGLVDEDGLVEIKTMVSSNTLFTAMVEGDISAYTDQINMALWLLGRRYCDLILWCPDLRKKLHVVRIERDEEAIAALELDLLEFDRTVEKYRKALADKLGSPNSLKEATNVQ